MAAAVVVVALLASAARAATAPEDRLATFLVALDELVARARPEGGWVLGVLPGERVHPYTAPLRFAERIAAPLGLADWDLVTMRSPGTPAAILTLLTGHRWTGRTVYRDTAARAGDLLVSIQMSSGGWFSEMPVHGPRPARWFDWMVQRTNIDDDVTPGAVRALLALWEVTAEPRYRAAAERGLAFLQAQQLPDGAWPLIARPNWKRRVWSDFEDYPTLNDGATSQAIVTLLAGFRVLGRADMLLAARRGGDWIVRAQHGAPQAGWAQQYDAAGAPAPARRYERVALASWETRYALDALLALVETTGEQGYCLPVEPAVRWLERSALSPGCWARFYELESNQPLYFNEKRQAVATAAESHQPYDWNGDFGIPALFRRVRESDRSVKPDTTTAARTLGDPGACPTITMPPFDPKTAIDDRQAITWATRFAAVLEPAAASACRVSSGK